MAEYAKDISIGCLEAIVLRDELPEKPVVQLLLKRMQAPGVQDRMRFMISDTVHFTNSCIYTLKPGSPPLVAHSLIRLDKYSASKPTNGRKVIIVADISVVRSANVVVDKIGDPIELNDAAVLQGQQPPAAAPLQQQNRNRMTNAASHQASGISATTHTGGNHRATEDNFMDYEHQQPAVNGYGHHRGGAPAAAAASSYGLLAPPSVVHPINSVTPYNTKWSIRARVTAKTPLKEYSNSRGSGKVFSVDLADESGEIRAACFNQEADRFYPMLEVSKIYYISKGQVKTANKKFSSIPHDYEITFNNETTIVPCTDDTGNIIPNLTYNFRPIDELRNVPKDSAVDVIGVVQSFGDVQRLTSKKTNQELVKRDVQLMDQSLCSIQLTLWGTEAENFQGDGHPIIAVKQARLSEFSGLSLSTGVQTSINLNPDIPLAHSLRGWYDAQGSGTTPQSLSTTRGDGVAGPSGNAYTLLGLVIADQLGTHDKPDWFTVKGTLMQIKRDNCLYMACPQADCNKKVMESAGSGLYHCEKCMKDHRSFKWRLMLPCQMADFTDCLWMTAFQSAAEQILGMTADQLGQLRSENPVAFDELLDKAMFKDFTLRCLAKTETYNDDTKVKYVINSATPVNVLDTNKRLIEEVEKLKMM